MGYHDDGEEHLFELNPADEEELVTDEDGKGKKRGKGALSAQAMKRAKLLNQAKLGGQGQKIKNMFLRSSQEVGPGMNKAKKAGKKRKQGGLAGAARQGVAPRGLAQAAPPLPRRPSR